MEKEAALDTLLAGGVIAILRAKRPDGLLEAAAAIAAGGVRAIEFTLNTPGALELIAAAKLQFGGKALVGAGTVLNAGEAEQALKAGAEFIVMPGIERGAVQTAQAGGVPVIPGAFTPSEVMAAWEMGGDLVKLFPASLGGPGYLKAVLAPLSNIRLVPTGGVTIENAAEYIQAGASAVAVGESLADSNAIRQGDFDRLTGAARQLLSAVKRAREEREQ